MRRYYLHRRKDIYYAELVDREGRKLGAKSTGKTSEDEALLVIAKWLEEGIPKKGVEKPVETVFGLSEILRMIRKTELDGNDAMKIVELLKKKELVDFSIVSKTGDGARIFTEFLDEFWDYTSSPYVKSLKADNKPIGRRHCYEMQHRLSFYSEFFKNRTLNSITKRDLTEFKLFLAEPRKKPEKYKGKFAEKLSASYRNKILIAGLTAIKWSFDEGIITVNAAAGFKRSKGTVEKRRVLTPIEAELVFKTKWKDQRSYIGNLLSITTGLRAGEVLALRKSDIGDKVLHIRHSWSTMDGLKSTKNGETRTVPLLPEVRTMLLDLLKENPHVSSVPDPYIFYGLLPDKPMDTKLLIGGLKAACIAAKVEPVVFHSHRHFFAARMSDKMTADQVMRITGHRSRAVFDGYADHVTAKNIEDMAEATAETFSKIIKFKKVG